MTAGLVARRDDRREHAGRPRRDARAARRRRRRRSASSTGCAIAVEESTRVNTAMLGAAARVCPFVDTDADPPDARRASSAAATRELVEANLRAFDRGFDELRLRDVRGGDEAPCRARPRPRRRTGTSRRRSAGRSSTPGSSIVRDLSASREGFLPALDLEKCVHCGLCDVVCPDLCFVWETEGDGRRAPARHRLPLLQGLPASAPRSARRAR